MIGTPAEAALRISGRSTISKEAIFMAGTPSAASPSTAAWSNGLEKKWIRLSRACSASLGCHSRGSEIASSSSCGERSSSRYANRGVFDEYSPAPVYVWNFTASAPASAAMSISSRAIPRSRLWLAPASAMT